MYILVNPPISSLLKKAENRFTLCIISGKRARQLLDGAKKLTDTTSSNALTVAIHEIDDNMITYVRTKSGIK